ncbi:ATP-binding protein [Peterkaempfera bronchialis]|nr:ATP-binding protein [Peterkaempfera bronchialis]
MNDRGAWATTVSFPSHPRNVARSRLLARTALAAWGAPQLADSAEILVSELVTNAVRYGSGPVSLALVLTEEALQISVSDCGPDLPATRPARTDEPGGRGLGIVERLCGGWQVTTRLRGKTVTCRLAGDHTADHATEPTTEPTTGPTTGRNPAGNRHRG